MKYALKKPKPKVKDRLTKRVVRGQQWNYAEWRIVVLLMSEPHRRRIDHDDWGEVAGGEGALEPDVSAAILI